MMNNFLKFSSLILYPIFNWEKKLKERKTNNQKDWKRTVMTHVSGYNYIFYWSAEVNILFFMHNCHVKIS